MTLSTTEALNGTSRTHFLTGGRQVSVLIPAGVHDGQELQFPGLGESPPWGGPPGALILSIAVTPAEQGLSPGQVLRKAIIDFVLGAIVFQIAVNVAATFIFPSFGTLVRTSWAWVGGWCLLLLSLCFYPTRKRWTTRLRWSSTVVLTVVVLANFIALTLLYQDVPGRFFQGPPLLYQADWTYSLNGWTSPPIGASSQAWSVSQGTLVSSGQLTSFPDPRCQIYRIEVLGSHIKVLVDGILVFDEQDSRFTHGGWVELWEEADRVRVSDFTISKVQG
jgi:hypothetical protein